MNTWMVRIMRPDSCLQPLVPRRVERGHVQGAGARWGHGDGGVAHSSLECVIEPILTTFWEQADGERQGLARHPECSVVKVSAVSLGIQIGAGPWRSPSACSENDVKIRYMARRTLRSFSPMLGSGKSEWSRRNICSRSMGKAAFRAAWPIRIAGVRKNRTNASLHSYGLYGYGLHSYGTSSLLWPILCLYSYGRYSYGLTCETWKRSR